MLQFKLYIPNIKYQALIWIVLLALNYAFAQSVEKLNSQIDSLTSLKAKFQHNIRKIEFDIQEIDRQLEVKVKQKEELMSIKFSKSIFVTAKKEIKMLDIGNLTRGNEISVIRKGENIEILKYENDFYFVECRNINGYVYYVSFLGIEKIEEYKLYWIERNKREKLHKEQAEKDLTFQKKFEIDEQLKKDQSEKESTAAHKINTQHERMPEKQDKDNLPAKKSNAPAYPGKTTIIEKSPGQWYQGGTLHKSKISEWKRGTDGNKLATCADFIAKLDSNVTVSTMMVRAIELRACINEATKGLSSTDNMTVVEVASYCSILLGYTK